MKTSIYYLFALMVLLKACDDNTYSSEPKLADTIIGMNKLINGDLKNSVILNSDITELYPGKDTLQLELKMKPGQHVTIPVDVRAGDSILGKLMSDDPTANIRFTQIALPDQTFDGPFGRELTYSVKSPGRYALIIGQNLMAGDPWSGNFTLKVWVK